MLPIQGARREGYGSNNAAAALAARDTSRVFRPYRYVHASTIVGRIQDEEEIMHVLKVAGPREVALLLRNLADEIERRSLEFEGRVVPLADALEAVVDLSEGGAAEVSVINVCLEHSTPPAWNLTELQQALAHPGG
jgi:hypothetical protein